MTLPKADLARFAYTFDNGPQADPDDEKAAMQKAEELRQFAVQNGAEKTANECRRLASKGCQVLNDSENRYQLERSNDTAWAFRIPVGGVGEIKRDNNQFEVLILLDIHAPEALDMHKPENMKIVAANAMRKSEPATHLIEALKPALEAPDPDFKAITDNLGGNFARYDNVSFSELAMNSQHREARELLKVVAEVRPEQTELFSNPVITNGRMYIFRVNQLTTPTDADFSTGKEAWKAQKAADPTRDLAINWLNQNMPSMSSLNIKPIQDKYGILQNNGTIK